MRATALPLAVLVFALSPLMTSCAPDDEGDAGPSPTEKPTDPPSTPLCEVDPERVAARERCRADDDCPCGTSCDRGECVARCEAAADCAEGERCDELGRCRPGDDGALSAPLAPREGDRAKLRVSPRLLTVTSGTEAREVTLHALGAHWDRLDDVRVEASDGLEVDCRLEQYQEEVPDFGADAGPVTSTSCYVPYFVWRWTLGVTGTRPLEPGEVRTLTVWAGGQQETITFTALDDVAMTAPEPLPPAFDVVGSYDGTLSLAGVGARVIPPYLEGSPYDYEPGWPAFEGHAPPAPLDLPVRLEVFPDDGDEYPFRIHDPMALLSPAGALEGRVVFDGGWRVRIDAHELIPGSLKSVPGGSWTDPEHTGVKARYLHQHTFEDNGAWAPMIHWPTLSNEEWIFTPEALDLELFVSFELVPYVQRNPDARYLLRFTRTGDLPQSATAPDVEPGTVDANDTRVSVRDVVAPTAFEDGIVDKAATEESARAFVESLATGGRHLAMCGNAGWEWEDAAFRQAVASWWYGLGWFGDDDADIGRFSSFQVVRESPADDERTHPVLRAMAAAVAEHAEADAESIFVNLLVRNVRSHWSEVRSSLSTTNPVTHHRELPCAIAYDAWSVQESGGGVLVTTDPLLEDRCLELEAATGCVPVEVSGVPPITHEVVTPVVVDLGDDDRAYLGAPFSGTVTKVCRFEGAPPACAEAAACYEPGAGDGRSSALSASFYSSSGDAYCATTGRSFGIDADDNPLGLSAGEMLMACLADLEALGDAPAPGLPLDAHFGSAGCVDVARFLLALGGASDVLRTAAIDVTATADVTRSALYTHRLLTRWAELHAFLAREVAETATLAQVLRRSPFPGVGAPPSEADVLSTSLRGWQLFFAPRFATALERLPGHALLSPDYRALLGPVPPDASSGAATPLSVAMLKALAAQADLATLVVEDAMRRGDVGAARATGRVLRHAVVVMSLAQELYARAEAACAEELEGLPCVDGRPPWAASYDAAALALQVAEQRLVTRTRSLLAGENPLGVEEVDLPLYFLGGNVSDDSRFFAISDYLVGRTGGDTTSWAPSLVADAAHKLTAARAAWLERHDRLVATEQSEERRQQRVDDVLESYGERLVELCGRPGDVLSSDVIPRWQEAHGYPFNPNDCHLALDRAECAIDPSLYLEAVSSTEAGYAACVLQELERTAPGRARFHDDALTRFALTCAPEEVQLLRHVCDEPPYYSCLRCDDGAASDVDLPPRAFLDILVDERVPVAALAEAEAVCRDAFPEARVPLPSASDLAVELPSSCYRGAIGEQGLALRSVSKEIEIARVELSELNEAYDIAMKSCVLRRSADNVQGAMLAQHNRQMHTLRAVKLAADIAAEVAGAVKDCADSMAGATAPWDKGAAGVACGAGAVEAAANSVSHGMQFAMDEAQAAFEQRMAEVEAQAAFDICQNDARHHLVGSRSQALRIQRALADLDVANASLRTLKANASLVWDEARAVLAAEATRPQTPLVDDVWLDEKVRAFGQAWRLAYRVTYLGVRAVEYELQQSLALRGSALRAEIPSDLENVLRELRTYTGPRSIQGSRPTNKKVVLSLRDQLLALEDRSTLPESELRLSPAERLRLRLTSPRYAVYDEDGAWLGQRVPFTLSPLGYTDLEDRAFEIYSQDSCAERLWSVNASILGGDGLVVGSDTTFTNVTVLKANTFFSQWCDDRAREAPYQLASVRPERNLFRDPEGGSAGFIGAQLGALVGQTESRALIQPAINVERARFEEDQYENGDSSQLAARGLYGEYALFFPAQVLSRVRDDGQRTAGLDLSRVEDILVRLDYVTAAR